MELERIREAMAQYLEQRDVNAAAAWPEGERPRLETPVTVVSLRECKTGPGGLLDYLGEVYDPGTGLWEERYGRRVELTFGLDTYAREGGQAELQTAFTSLANALAAGSPDGLAVRQFTCGETEYDGKARLLKRTAQVVCTGWLCAVKRAEEAFLDFELRGALKQ